MLNNVNLVQKTMTEEVLYPSVEVMVAKVAA